MIFHLNVFLPFIAFLINFFVWTYVISIGKFSKLNRSIILYLSAIMLYSILLFYIRLVPNLDENIMLLKLIPMTYIPVGLLFLNFIYHLISRRRDSLLLVFSIIVWISLITNAFTDIFVTKFIKSAWGYHLESSHPLYFYFAFVSIFLPAFLGLYFLLREVYQNQSSPYKSQIKLIFGGTTFIWLAVLLSEFSIFYFEMYEKVRFGPISVAIVALFILPAIVKYNFITPSKREISTKLFTSLPDAVFLLNENGIIIESNTTAKNLINSTNLSHLDSLSANYLFVDYSHENNYSDHITKLLFNQAISISISQRDYKEFGFKMGKLLIVRDVSTILLSEQQLKQAQEVSQTGSFQYDLISKKVTWSAELYRIYEKDPRDFNPTNMNFLSEILHPEDKNRIEELVKDKLNSGEPFEYNYRIILSDNRERVMHCKCIITLNDENVPICIDGTAQNITELEKAQTELIKSEEKYRNLFENSPDAIVIHDVSNIYYCNTAAVKLSGLNSIDELKLIKINDFFSNKYLEEVQTKIVNYIKGNHVDLNRQEIILPNGSSLFIEARGIRTEFDGRPAIQSSIRDVTPRVVAEKQLKNSEERYRKLVEASPDAIIIYTLEDGILFVNNSALKIAGATSIDQFIGKSPMDFVHVTNLEIVQSRIERILNGEDMDYHYEIFVKIDGSRVDAEAKGVLITFDDKPAIQTTIRDISDRMRAERILIESEKRFRELYENAPAAYLSISIDGKINSCNNMITQLLGYEVAELIGKPVLGLYADNNFGKSRAQKVFEQFKAGLSTANEELQMVKKDGTAHWINLTVFPVKNENGEIIETRSMVVDINERKLVQREFESNRLQMLQAQNIAQLGSWEWDMVQNTISWSENLYSLYGTDRNSFQVTFERFMSKVHPDDQEYVTNTITECTKTQIPMDYFHRTIPINGQIKTMHCNGIVVADEHGTPLTMVGTAQDVSKAIEDEVALKESEKRLASAQEIAHLGNWEENHQSGEIFWSDECKKILGFENQESISLGTFWEIVHPEDLNRLKSKWEEIEKTLVPYEGTFRILHNDGAIKYIREKANFTVDSDGNLLLTTGTVQDITEIEESNIQLENSQLRLKQAQQLALIGNWEFDAKTGKTFWSEECKRLLGFGGENKIENEAYWTKIHPDDHDWLLDLWKESKISLKPYKVVYRATIDNQIKYLCESTEFTANQEGKLYRCLGTIQDITTEKNAEEEIKDSHNQLRGLSKHLQTIQEDEREHIAREIHDELGQRLTGIKMDLSWIGKKIPKGNKTVFERINSLNLLIDDTVQSVRKISSELHPVILDDLGLKAAMEWQIGEFIRRTNTKCDLVMNEDEFEFDAIQEKALFRIMQESLTNIMRHADAKKVSVALEINQDGINFSIKDDGIGIDNYEEKTLSSFGILSMQERAYSLGGVLSISSKLNEGTNINLFIPTQLEQS